MIYIGNNKNSLFFSKEGKIYTKYLCQDSRNLFVLFFIIKFFKREGGGRRGEREKRRERKRGKKEKERERDPLFASACTQNHTLGM